MSDSPHRPQHQIRALLAKVSHDLRSPLTSVYMVIQRLRRQAAQDDRDEDLRSLASVEKSIVGMMAMIDYMLDPHTSDAEIVQPRRLSVDLQRIVDDQIVRLQAIAELKKIALINRIPTGTTAHADPIQIGRVFHNLLDNAIKYSREGDRVELYRTVDGRYGVADTGRGLDAKQAQSLFQSSPHRTAGNAGEAGFGTGLATCRAIVEAHGGAIVAEPVAAGGLRIEFSIDRGQRRALLVLSSSERLVAARNYLSATAPDMEVQSVTSYRDAVTLIERLANVLPDLVLIEYDGADSECLALVRLIRNAPLSDHCAIFLVAPGQPASQFTWLRREAVLAGADDLFEDFESVTVPASPACYKHPVDL